MIPGIKQKQSKFFGRLFLVVLYAFFYFPMVVLIVFSFNSRSFPAPWDQFTFQWYTTLFSERELWESFFNSSIIALSSSSICILLTCMMLFFLSRGGRIDRMMNIFYLNLILPETVLGVSLLSFFSLLQIPLGLVTIIIAHTIVGLGFAAPIAFLRFRELDPVIFEASRVLGATPSQTFFRVVLPLMKPVLVTTGLMIFVISFDDFVLSYFCSGAGFQTLSLFLVSSVRYGLSPVVNALATFLLIFTFILASVFFSMGKRARRFV